MGITLVTGSTGLVGSSVARLLAERGDRVRAGVRSSSRLDNLHGLDVERMTCDILDRRSLRRALRGVDRVFHCAGLTDVRARPDDLYLVNATGTRVLCEEAHRAGVEHVVHTSSAAAAVGPAPHGSTADETQAFRAGGLGLAYVDSKREAEVQALRAAAAGLPVVIANPTHVFGAGDVYRTSTQIVRRYLLRQIPVFVEGALNIVDVEDVARGLLAADERGAVGERYILGNRNFTWDRLFADLARLSGVEPPPVRLPAAAALAVAQAMERLPGTPAVTVTEARAAAQWWAYRSTKAKRELGWEPSHHEDTLVSTIAWYRARDERLAAGRPARQPLALRVVGDGVRRTLGAFDRLAP